MLNNINKIIEEKISMGNLIVLKGFKLSNFGLSEIDVDKMLDDKMSCFMEIYSTGRKIISYEEFIALYNFILTQYKNISVIENPLYTSYYPMYANLSDDTTNNLLKHFNNDEEYSEDEYIGNLDNYTEIYSNVMQTETGIAVCYNVNESLFENEKIERVGISITPKKLEVKTEIDEQIKILNICDEDDYLDLVNMLASSDKVYTINYGSFNLDRKIIKQRLELLNGYFDGRIIEFKPVDDVNNVEISEEIKELTKKYWDIDKFRNIKTYDLNELENGTKKIKIISQYNIISDIIEQVENCLNHKSYRDIFVTAPTGSGKSLMFQLPAVYLAEKYNLVTLVITPLIGLMQDQVEHMKKQGYVGAETINSDISPIVKQEILDRVTNGQCHILYLSPESLLSRSDVEQLIGNRRIGMVVIDEAHIVTTWGKQFRPDYWYLGDHIRKIRTAQSKKEQNPSSFIIATFTATATYGGNEDMYQETINSMQMVDPITYLGYLKRNNIVFDVSKGVHNPKDEYLYDKFKKLAKVLDEAIMHSKKVLVYFPTVRLIGEFDEFVNATTPMGPLVSVYHGQLDPDKKTESLSSYREGKKLIMLATKAFGMGIDIPDIDIVLHFAPTGNVCDYMQEIGRAARKQDIDGKAIYQFLPNDFRYINQLHGMSAIRKYQLIEVVKKILEIYTQQRYKSGKGKLTRKRNELLIDAENFQYIFEGKNGGDDDSNLINKVKTAMLMIQKDFERKGFSPFYMRPIPMFAKGFFVVFPQDQTKLSFKYKDCLTMKYQPMNICEVNLQNIWEKSYKNSMSFPKFKYLLYTQSNELDFNEKYHINPAVSVEVKFEINHELLYNKLIGSLADIVKKSYTQNTFISFEDMKLELSKTVGISTYKSETILNVFIAGMSIYGKKYLGPTGNRPFTTRILKNGTEKFLFASSAFSYFKWLRNSYDVIQSELKEDYLYLAKDKNSEKIMIALGVLESFGVLKFNSLGGSNSQLYIYVNETKSMHMIISKPAKYHNKLLEIINLRHQESVKMLTYLFESDFKSDELWNELENYFLGILPKELKCNFKSENDKVEVEDQNLRFDQGESLYPDYQDWDSILYNIELPNGEYIKHSNVQLPSQYACNIKIGELNAFVYLAWTEQRVAITDGEESEEFRKVALDNGWVCIPADKANGNNLNEAIKR